LRGVVAARVAEVAEVLPAPYALAVLVVVVEPETKRRLMPPIYQLLSQ
jgi:hypothetical protein